MSEVSAAFSQAAEDALDATALAAAKAAIMTSDRLLNFLAMLQRREGERAGRLLPATALAKEPIGSAPSPASAILTTKTPLLAVWEMRKRIEEGGFVLFPPTKQKLKDGHGVSGSSEDDISGDEEAVSEEEISDGGGGGGARNSEAPADKRTHERGKLWRAMWRALKRRIACMDDLSKATVLPETAVHATLSGAALEFANAKKAAAQAMSLVPPAISRLAYSRQVVSTLRAVEEGDESATCSVCMDTPAPVDACLTPCGHLYCIVCLQDWIATKNGIALKDARSKLTADMQGQVRGTTSGHRCEAGRSLGRAAAWDEVCRGLRQEGQRHWPRTLRRVPQAAAGRLRQRGQ